MEACYIVILVVVALVILIVFLKRSEPRTFDSPRFIKPILLVLREDGWLTTENIKQLVESRGGPQEPTHYYFMFMLGVMARGYVECDEENADAMATTSWRLTKNGKAIVQLSSGESKDM